MRRCNMGWADLEGKGASNREDKLIIEPNTTRLVRILLENNEEPLSVWSHFIPNITGASKRKGVVIYCPGKGICPACATDKYRTKLIHAVNVYDFQTQKVRILEAGNMIMKHAKMIKDQYGTFNNINIAIRRDGADKNTTYALMPMPDNTPIPAGLQKFDLHTIYIKTPVNKVAEWIAEMELGLQAPVQSPHLTPTPMNTNVQQVMQQIGVPPQVQTYNPPPPAYVTEPAIIGAAVEAVKANVPPVIPKPTAPTTTVDEPLTFGKYKGKTLQDIASIDLDYLKWISANVVTLRQVALDLYTNAMMNGQPEQVTIVPEIPKTPAEEDAFIKNLEAEKAAPNYVVGMEPNVVAGVIKAETVGAISDSIDMKVARIQSIMERDYTGNFKTVIDKMIEVTKSPQFPNGKMQLGDFDVPELKRLEHALLTK